MVLGVEINKFEKKTLANIHAYFGRLVRQDGQALGRGDGSATTDGQGSFELGPFGRLLAGRQASRIRLARRDGQVLRRGDGRPATDAQGSFEQGLFGRLLARRRVAALVSTPPSTSPWQITGRIPTCAWPIIPYHPMQSERISVVRNRRVYIGLIVEALLIVLSYPDVTS